MFACALKSARAASNSAGQSEAPGSKAFHRERKLGFTGTTCAAPICEGDSFSRGGPRHAQTHRRARFARNENAAEAALKCRVRCSLCALY
jgi:hypothetical protein